MCVCVYGVWLRCGVLRLFIYKNNGTYYLLLNSLVREFRGSDNIYAYNLPPNNFEDFLNMIKRIPAARLTVLLEQQLSVIEEHYARMRLDFQGLRQA